MHAASGTRLGDAHPRREGPTDLRLVPPALAAWGTAALMVHATPGWTTGVVVACLVLGSALLLPRPRPGPGSRPRPGPGPRTEPGWAREGGRGPQGGGTGARTKVSLAAVLLCAGAAAASAGLHGADLRRGPVPALAERYARVTAEVELTSDPRLTRPRIHGNHAAPAAVLLQAEVRRVRGPDGTVVKTRTPVLVLVDADDRPGRAAWLSLLPSTRVRVAAHAGPAMTGGDRVAAVLRVRGAGAPAVVQQPSTVQRLAGRLRAGLREATDGLDPDARALLPGFVVGDTSRVPAELDEAFRATDLTHLLAVSGANFTILLALFIGPPGLAQRAERRGLAPRLGIPLRATALAGGALSLGFVIVCRPEPSVVRAATCGSLALLAIVTGRRRSLVPALATAVLLLVLYDPWLARSYGFLLSVLATGALLTLAPRWSAALQRRRVPPRPAEALAAAGAAQAVCAPVVAVLSAKVSLVAVPCNLLAEFAVAPATVLGFATLATAPVAMPVAECLAWCASWPTGWIADIARTGASLPGAGVDWPGSWAGAALLVLVTALVVLVGRRIVSHPYLTGACLVAFLLVVVQPPPLTRVITGWPPPGWRLVMCDVGQGDATVLAAGEGAGVVVDVGPDPVLADRCLTALGITEIPLVVLTHFHADHVMGLPGVLRGRAVGAIAATAFEEPAEQAAFVREEAAARRIPLTRAVAGEERRTGSLTWRVLWPPGDAPTPDGPNDASVTMLVRSSGLTLLLLGDLEPPGQRELARSPEAAALGAVDVLKVAHHGSAYQDPGLIRAMAPRLALISVGADNPYGHPAPGTVAALRAGGATVLRTDEDGAIAVAGTAKELLVARD
ncbi:MULTISPECIES: ComEC/Rec2 family competence protein [Streptomyces]|nr:MULTISPECIES: ComEC/Rec2 family competence protein [Streptomyces]MBP5863755.1 MBL fold metallo-hydrolase [Streptomyces sp. LBUM 1484]MBP5905922.1 MBL fold metallo-hydrolase [Streptomyces sp. LBUM 1478]MBP5931549.1 MBL fold metallo-hydrolase [Streptomyces sp. LBUM 1479]KFG09855.1 membrane protein [Streptomyces scabiei]MBP5899478.1 MBL fold metallo-hydrolase [Streptomyces sp. LBUM 1488]